MTRLARPLGGIRLLVAMVLVAGLLAAGLAVESSRPSLRRPVLAAVEHGHRNLRVLLVGDSIAGTLGVGLAQAAPPSGVTLINAGIAGCSVSVAWAGGWPVEFAGPAKLAPPCQSARQLTAYWEGYLRRYRPDVVIYASRVDSIAESVRSGTGRTMTSLLDPSFRSSFAAAMRQATAVLASTGAHVILTTAVPTKFDNPKAWLSYDAVVAQVAARSPGTASVFDLGAFFGGGSSPPVFSLDSPSGVRWRCTDGFHITTAGGLLASGPLYRMAWTFWHAPPPGGLPPVPSTVANQPWPSYAPNAAVMGCLS